jgi:hypothetical protein
VPKRIRHFLQRNSKISSGVLRVFMRAVETTLRKRSPGAPTAARFGAAAFLHRSGSSLNEHPHFHSAVTDGVFAETPSGQTVFYEASDLTQDDIESLQAKLHRRVLAYLERHGCLDTDAFASERLGIEKNGTVVYTLKKPSHDGKAYLVMAPLELLQRLAAIIPPPRTNLVRYFGVLAPNAALREKVVSSAGPSAALFEQLISAAQQMDLEVELDRPRTQKRRASYLWAMLIARIYEVLPLLCPKCSNPMRITAVFAAPEGCRFHHRSCECLHDPRSLGRANKASAAFPRKRTSSNQDRVPQTGDNLGVITSFVASAHYPPPLPPVPPVGPAATSLCLRLSRWA